MNKLICPCCGDELRDLDIAPGALDQMFISSLKGESAPPIGVLVMTLFGLMHGKIEGEHLTEEGAKKLP